MHFQLPPADGAKLVYCLSGEVLDVALDVRLGSPTFGQAIHTVLSPERRKAVYMPCGVAHGFLTISGPATLVYNLEAEYCSHLDSGIRWDSFGMNWGVEQPIISDRDLSLPSFSVFRSPFRFVNVQLELGA
jgi:dTDP-4-dehydrorhamnose 3,5-epimerase